MALSEKVVVRPEDISGNDGTVPSALRMFSARRGPVTYNPWQSAYYSLLRDFKMVDEDLSEQEVQVYGPAAARQRRISKLFNEIQAELHGPDHLAEAVKKMVKVAPAASSCRQPLAEIRDFADICKEKTLCRW